MVARARQTDGDIALALLSYGCVLGHAEAGLAHVEGECTVIVADRQADAGEVGASSWIQPRVELRGRRHRLTPKFSQCSFCH